MSIFDKIFSDPNEKYLKKIQPLVDKINKLEPKFKNFSDQQIIDKTNEFKKRLNNENLDAILPEAFALVREAAKKTLNQRHFDVQLIGGIVLHQGKIAEMKTGEGKTLSATLPLYLNALKGKGCHLITVNDYLTKRDMVWMGQIYYALGLSVGCIVHNAAYIYDPLYRNEPEETLSNNQGDSLEVKVDKRDQERDAIGVFKVVDSYLRPVSRKEAYKTDITYGTNNEFGFDYLRDNMARDIESETQRGFSFAIIDEVDSILIDEARTPLIISAPDIESSKMYEEYSRIIPRLNSKTDYEIDEKMKAVTLNDEGIDKIEKILGMKDIYQEKGIKYLHHLEQALRAEVLFKKDRDYVIKNGEVIIVDEFTGRTLPGRRYSGGLHQAIEAKEGVRVQPESLTLSSITFQNYFRMYKKLAGMTGTALTSAEEFDKVYKLEVIVVPTNKPMIRIDMPDEIYKSKQEKNEAIIEDIKKRYQKGQPVLVGTTSIEKNEYLGKLLDREGVPHRILNAKYHEKEGEIIAQAGKLGVVTIATNMAGRGVDIVLGGNPPNLEEAEKVKTSGGLHVIGTERHEARRIDNQLRGRTGRQGDPGSSQFFLSLEDDLMRIFGGDKIKSIMTGLKIPDNQPIKAGLISRAVESAQTKIEGMNFDLRKHILEYDDVMNKHRGIIFKKRREILEKAQNSKIRPYILEIIKNNGYTEADYEKKEKEVGEENMRQIDKFVSLKILDTLWMNHLEEMERLRDSVRLRAYGQRDPLVEYKNEGHKMFHKLLSMIESSIANTILKVSVAPKPIEVPEQNIPQYNKSDNRTTISSNGKLKKKPGRNEPCPCGSGKKYKKCCWPKFG
ncbi:MAG: preprotein translocase subunit SecA [Patescibacteria group bacterium]|nr:preprotein translocase subunit SecA [Patescibacteria group bacterium]